MPNTTRTTTRSALEAERLRLALVKYRGYQIEQMEAMADLMTRRSPQPRLPSRPPDKSVNGSPRSAWRDFLGWMHKVFIASHDRLTAREPELRDNDR